MQPEYPLFQWSEQQRAASSPSAPPDSAVSTGGEHRSRHPLSQAFGDLPPAAREKLVERVRRSGTVREIPTLDNQVLLDWELYNIALNLGLPVQFREFSGEDPLAFIIVSCLHQPQWDKGQCAVIAVRLHAWRERGRPGKSVLSTDLSSPADAPESETCGTAGTAEMAAATQVSPTFITRAKRVEELGLGEAVVSGELKFAEAYRRVKLVLDAGLGDTVRDNQQDFETAYRKTRAVADAGFIKRVKARDLTCDEAYRKALAGETGGVAAVRARPPTKAELTKRVEELERENQRLVVEAGRIDESEARAAAAEAEVKRLTAVLSHSGLAA